MFSVIDCDQSKFWHLQCVSLCTCIGTYIVLDIGTYGVLYISALTLTSVLFIDSDLSAQIQEGQVTRISVLRGSCDLGMSIVGGSDTPLVSDIL